MSSDPGTYGAALGPAGEEITVDLVDPSLFTIPYDVALVRGLMGAGVETRLIGRPLREAEAPFDVPSRAHFYRLFDGAPRKLGAFGAALKAFEHCVDGLRLIMAKRSKGAVVHFQWLPFPLIDKFLIMALKRRSPVVVTVHDTMPFNGTPTSKVQSYGFLGALAQADRVIVHTQTGKARLVEAGLKAAKIEVIPHGPLGAEIAQRPKRATDRWSVVAFGKMRPYKGIDVLLEALATLSPSDRALLRVIVAGEAMMDLTALKAQIQESGLQDCVELREGFLDDDGLADLFAEADAFVFPYKEIEASGVLYLVEGLGRWIIASRLGAFVEAIEDGVSGSLVPPQDPVALGQALAEAARTGRVPDKRPNVIHWDQIAARTVEVYRAALTAARPSTRTEHRPVVQFQDTK